MSLISKETLLMQLQRSEMASEVTLPIDSFRDLLYQAMPKEWVGLTDEQREDIWDEMVNTHGFAGDNTEYMVDLVITATEDKLKGKNNVVSGQ